MKQKANFYGQPNRSLAVSFLGYRIQDFNKCNDTGGNIFDEVLIALKDIICSRYGGEMSWETLYKKCPPQGDIWVNACAKVG